MSVSHSARTYARKYLVDGVLVDKGNELLCALCDNEAKVFVYYPPLSDSHLAPSEIERVCLKFCKGHYDQAKTKINRSSLPVPMERLIQSFGTRLSGKKYLKGWAITKDDALRIWFIDRAAITEDYILFETWAKSIPLGYITDAARKEAFNEFLNNNPELVKHSIIAFQEYLFPSDDVQSAFTKESSQQTYSSTMFDV